MPTPEELMKAFDAMAEKTVSRGVSPRGGIPSSNALTRSFQALEEAAGVRPSLGTVTEAAPQAAEKLGKVQRMFQYLRSWKTPVAAASAVEATKQAAKMASNVAKGDWLAEKTGGWVTKGGLGLRSLYRIPGGVAIGTGALGLGLNVLANNTLDDAQGDPNELLRKYGMEVEVGSTTRPDMGIGDTYGWYSGAELKHPIDTMMRAWEGKGDPNWTDSRSDINQLRVFGIDGQEITQPMSNDMARAQMLRQADLFRAAGLMDNKVRAQRGPSPVYSPADLLGNARKK